MRTFWECFMQTVQQKLDAGEITQEKADKWIQTMRYKLKELAVLFPQHPITDMPKEHYKEYEYVRAR